MIKGQPCPNDGRELINMDRPVLFTRLMEVGLQVAPLFFALMTVGITTVGIT